MYSATVSYDIIYHETTTTIYLILFLRNIFFFSASSRRPFYVSIVVVHKINAVFGVQKFLIATELCFGCTSSVYNKEDWIVRVRRRVEYSSGRNGLV